MARPNMAGEILAANPPRPPSPADQSTARARWSHKHPKAGSVRPVPLSYQAGTGRFASAGAGATRVRGEAGCMTSYATELEAIVAHGLLNSLAVLSGAAATLLAYGRQMEEEDVATLVTAIDAQSGVFTEGLKVLLEHSSVAFADAATAVSLGAGVCS